MSAELEGRGGAAVDVIEGAVEVALFGGWTKCGEPKTFFNDVHVLRLSWEFAFDHHVS